LESFSFKVTLAASAEEGLEEIQRADTDQPYGLVLMDWKMPGMDGLEASEQIKNHKNLSKIPAIILVTAYGHEELIQRAEQIGLDGFLIKPVGPSVLFDTIMHAFGEGIPETSRAARRNKDFEALKGIQGAQVLLVEDNEINQQVAMEILQGAGLNVTVANDGQEGVEAAKQTQYDAILMDIQMPVMDGYTATRQIRELQLKAQSSKLKGETADHAATSDQAPGAGSQASNLQPLTSNLPIIAMTAHAMAGDEQKSIEAGMNDHVTKPIDPDQLFAALVKWIKPASERTVFQKPQAIDAIPEPDQAIPEEEGLPESLPWFDLSDGLKRLQGNKKLYRKLLLNFATDYYGAANDIRIALEAKDFERTHSLVHNIKGLAGNLAATDLQTAAANLEKLVKGVQKKTPPARELKSKLSELENALNQALESAQSLSGSAEECLSKLSDEEISNIPAELAQDIAKRIRDAAEMGDVMTLNAISEEIKTHSDSCLPLSKHIVQMAEDFDLDGIQKLADDLDAC
jgi:CheY-like chemotaxis protein